jgi:nucleotide-binding universal stress UspA family protein
MFHRILVAIDSSQNNRIVFEKALELASLTTAHLMLLHVLSHEEGSPNISMVGLEYSPTLSREVADIYQKQWVEFEQRNLEMLQSCSEKAATAGVKAEFMQRMGSPGRTICTVAQTWDADLILIGRRGHSGLSEFWLGSVSNYVLHHTLCSVLVIQGVSSEASPGVQEQQAALIP